MAQAQAYKRNKDGLRIDFRGVNTVRPVDQMPPGKYPFAQNVRRRVQEGTTGRPTEGAALFTFGSPVQSVRRMNDSTPSGPVSGFVIISASGTALNANGVQVNNSLSGKRVSLVPFRPNQSVQPWMYVADDNVMLKVRSDGLTYKDGIKEPQVPPTADFHGLQIPASEPGAVFKNGWGPGGHVGAYEGGVNQGLTWGFDASTTNPYANAANALDGDVNTKASSVQQHTHAYAGCIWSFTNPSAPVIPNGLTINVLSEIPPNGSGGLLVTKRSAGVWYTIDGGTSWTQIYNSGTRSKQWDTIVLPANTDPAMVQIMAFSDSHDDMVHYVYEVQLGVQSVNTLYRYTYRSSKTGALSNPSPPSLAGFNLAVQSVDLTATASTDPQVDKIDFYRFGGGLLAYTYVGTAPNSAPTYTDLQPDLVVVNNPQLEFDNFEPFPSIDLPRSGIVNVVAGVITWVSGDQFNTRWLPGNIIVIDGVPYSTDKRPTSATTMTATNTVDGNALSYEIAQPALAAQPMRSMWGPTDNVAFMFGCRDPLRPGTLYFTKGNNPDSAPDTNQIEVTSPSEPLQNGCIVGGQSVVGSTERFWLCYPNFFNALATVTGTAGSPFTLVESIANRGLYAQKGICTDGGALMFFIGKDGIYVSPGGSGSKSITDEDLFNLFPHEGSVQQNITIGATGVTIFAPDFSNPDAMELSFANGYLYFDYKDLTGTVRTLVYDVYAQGWVIDAYQFPVVTHSFEEGVVEGLLVGCTDGTIRQLQGGGIETGTVSLMLPADNAGDARAEKRYGDIYIEAAVAVGNTLTVTPYTSLYKTLVTGAAPSALASTGGGVRSPYIVDFSSGNGLYAKDLEAVFSWSLGTSTIMSLWQVDVIEQPEGVQNRPSDWDDAGTPEPKFVQGFRLEADSFGISKNFKVQSGDDLTIYTPDQVPVTFNGQSIKPFTFTPPFIAHSMRLISTDGVQWRTWGVQWVFELFPDLTPEWQTEGSALGMIGWGHLREMNIAHISTSDLTLLVIPDKWPQFSLTIANSGGIFTKTKVTLPANKSKIYSFRLSSASPFRNFEKDMELKLKSWGSADAYQIIKPFGGNSGLGANL